MVMSVLKVGEAPAVVMVLKMYLEKKKRITFVVNLIKGYQQ